MRATENPNNNNSVSNSASNSSVSDVYLHVIDDVVAQMRPSFLDLTGEDSVLSELQSLWELKMRQSGAVTGRTERNSAPVAVSAPARVHDLNVPYEGGEYETPTADMFFTPTPAQTPVQTPFPAQTPVQTPFPVEPGQYQYYPGSEGVIGGTPRTVSDTRTGRSTPEMQNQAPWMTKKSLDVDVNVAYGETADDEGRIADPPPLTEDFYAMLSGKRKRDEYSGNIPRRDGSADY